MLSFAEYWIDLFKIFSVKQIHVKVNFCLKLTDIVKLITVIHSKYN